MTDGEFEGVLVIWAGLWPAQAEIPQGVVAGVWRDLWEPYDGEEVKQALYALAKEGLAFPPPPGMVAKKAGELRYLSVVHFLQRVPKGSGRMPDDPEVQKAMTRLEMDGQSIEMLRWSHEGTFDEG